MDRVNWKSLVGSRVLVKPTCGYKSYQSKVTEVYVVEVSPSGKRVRLRYPSGAERWELSTYYQVVETLGSGGRDKWK